MLKGMTVDQRRMIIILSLLNFFNFMDRQVVFPLFSHIQAEFAITDAQLGWIATVFVIVFSVSSIPLGILADRYSRKVVIAVGVLFWSLATMLSGAARGFKSLLTFRGLVGIGEASYSPASTAMIADNFSHKLRARVQGLFYTGTFLGGTIGAMLGGVIVFYTDSWRLAFFLVAIPGFILAFLSLTLKDKSARGGETDSPEEPSDFWPHAGEALRNQAYMWIVVSGLLQAFAAGAYVTWGIEYVHRYTSYNLRDASLLLGGAMMLAGLIGILLGSHIADKWQERNKAGRSWLVSVAGIISVPFLWWGFQVGGNGIQFIILFFIGIMFFSFWLGPTAAIIHDITAPKVRATAFAVYMFIIHLLGQASAPAVTGWISDAANLNFAMEMATLVLLAGGIAFIPVAWHIHKGNVLLYEDE